MLMIKKAFFLPSSDRIWVEFIHPLEIPKTPFLLLKNSSFFHPVFSFLLIRLVLLNSLHFTDSYARQLTFWDHYIQDYVSSFSRFPLSKFFKIISLPYNLLSFLSILVAKVFQSILMRSVEGLILTLSTFSPFIAWADVLSHPRAILTFTDILLRKYCV